MMGMHPARMAAMGAAPPVPGMMPPMGMAPPMGMPPMGMPMQMGMPPMGMGMHMGMGGITRSADEMMGGSGGVEPIAKRPRIEKLPEGHYYPEEQWLSLHPFNISLQIQLPTITDKPELKMNGSIVAVPELPLTLLISTLRDRLLTQIGSSVAASRIRFSYGSKVLTNSQTLASYNLDDGDLVVVTLRDAKKK
jgi:splicing factor 3A subunit 1